MYSVCTPTKTDGEPWTPSAGCGKWAYNKLNSCRTTLDTRPGMSDLHDSISIAVIYILGERTVTLDVGSVCSRGTCIYSLNKEQN
jgi:hypothetical protein